MTDKYLQALTLAADDDASLPVAPSLDASLARLPVEIAPGAFALELQASRPAPSAGPRP
jgi:hypothetical protein